VVFRPETPVQRGSNEIYSTDMAQTETRDRGRCSRCGQSTSEVELQTCMICRSLFCHHCAVEGYGREFCSAVCRGFFFHGDGDEGKEDF
jgi:hypothetical protein